MNDKAMDGAVLDRVIREACLAMLDALPRPQDCRHEFSPEFGAKMESLRRRVRRRESLRRCARGAVAAVLALVLCTAAWLAVDTDARAGFFGWVREACENTIIYRFTGSHAPGTVLPQVEFGWLPEGYEEVQSDGNNTQQGFVYLDQNDSRQGFIFQYFFSQQGSQSQYFFNDTEYTQKSVKVSGKDAVLYLCTDGSETNELIWIDDERGIVFELSSYLDEDVMLHIAESIKLLD